MSLDLMNKQRVRSAQPVIAAAQSEIELQSDQQGNSLVIQGGPERMALVAVGGSFIVEDTTPRACVTAYPTTAGLFGLFNGEDAGGKAYVIDRIGATFMGQTAATAWAARVLANLRRDNVALPTNLVNPFSLTGAANYGGKARSVNAPATVAADGWFGIGPSAQCPAGVTVNPGVGLDIPVNGALIVRPQKQLALSCLATATAVTVLLSIWYHEVQLQFGT